MCADDEGVSMSMRWDIRTAAPAAGEDGFWFRIGDGAWIVLQELRADGTWADVPVHGLHMGGVQ